ncbi:MAG: hypothetical protein KAH56_07860 [Candidatus Krumholzibacteria bacterium]|nr:hypothetical protein [Candidatus Krumholzibacteria bacterium]
MKKLIFAVCALVALSPLCIGTGHSEPTHPNEIGLYMNEDGTGATGTFDLGIPIYAYLVLTKPADTANNDTPYATINAFECRLTFSSSEGLFKLGDQLPPTSINIGDQSSISQGFLEYIVGIANDVPVTDESVVLIEFVFLAVVDLSIEVTIGPTSKPSRPGVMVFQSESGHLVPMYPVSGSYDDPIFIFNGEAVDVVKESFGSVKALYR